MLLWKGLVWFLFTFGERYQQKNPKAGLKLKVFFKTTSSIYLLIPSDGCHFFCWQLTYFPHYRDHTKWVIYLQILPVSLNLMFWVCINYIRACKSMWAYKTCWDDAGGMQKARQSITSLRPASWVENGSWCMLCHRMCLDMA